MQRRSFLGVVSIEICAATQQQPQRRYIVIAAGRPQGSRPTFIVDGVDIEIVPCDSAVVVIYYDW